MLLPAGRKHISRSRSRPKILAWIGECCTNQGSARGSRRSVDDLGSTVCLLRLRKDSIARCLQQGRQHNSAEKLMTPVATATTFEYPGNRSQSLRGTSVLPKPVFLRGFSPATPDCSEFFSFLPLLTVSSGFRGAVRVAHRAMTLTRVAAGGRVLRVRLQASRRLWAPSPTHAADSTSLDEDSISPTRSSCRCL